MEFELKDNNFGYSKLDICCRAMQFIIFEGNIEYNHPFFYLRLQKGSVNLNYCPYCGSKINSIFKK